MQWIAFRLTRIGLPRAGAKAGESKSGRQRMRERKAGRRQQEHRRRTTTLQPPALQPPPRRPPPRPPPPVQHRRRTQQPPTGTEEPSSETRVEPSQAARAACAAGTQSIDIDLLCASEARTSTAVAQTPSCYIPSSVPGPNASRAPNVAASPRSCSPLLASGTPVHLSVLCCCTVCSESSKRLSSPPPPLS